MQRRARIIPPALPSGLGSLRRAAQGNKNPDLTFLWPYNEKKGVLGTGGLLNRNGLCIDNPFTYNAVAINANTPTNVPVLSGNAQRVALIIQNNSTATVAGDVAPFIWVGFNTQAQVGVFGVAPGGGGIYFDFVPPRDAIYILIGASLNAGASVVVQGAVVQGVITPSQNMTTPYPADDDEPLTGVSLMDRPSSG